ncbi:MAG: sodium:solute symporter family protein [Bacteroidales bacterium]|jgi:SSS family solute:Na+ symporter
MIRWIIIFGILYISALILLSLRSRKRNKSTRDFILAGSNIGPILGFMSFAATLFSTFTLMGMPDFFRTHGIGAWLFLAFSDAAMVFLIVWFGFTLRKKAAEKGFQGMAGLLGSVFESKLAAYVYFFGVFIFLIPYVAIQIRGVAIFLSAIFPGALPPWGWALLIVTLMLIYSELGGLKAIMHADVMQGILLLTVVWIIAVNSIRYFGGVGEMFESIEKIDTSLLSLPGPKGLFNFQFLLASFLAILLIPVSQPQLSTRLVILKDTRTLHRMAVAVGIFAMLVILPTLPIGFYGAAKYSDLPAAEYISRVLIFDQPGLIAAATIIGLTAAALSTSDSQIFALGSELRSMLKGKDKIILLQTRAAMIFFALAALIFSVLSSDQLVMLARVSFAGTSIMAPMILSAVFLKNKPGRELIFLTFAGLVVFILSLLNVIPDHIGNIRMDLFILSSLFLLAIMSGLMRYYRFSGAK